jgi:hypothetical protein
MILTRVPTFIALAHLGHAHHLHTRTIILFICWLYAHLAQFFKSQGADWPGVLWHLDDGGVHGCWKLNCLKWAIKGVSLLRNPLYQDLCVAATV